MLKRSANVTKQTNQDFVSRQLRFWFHWRRSPLLSLIQQNPLLATSLNLPRGTAMHMARATTNNAALTPLPRTLASGAALLT
jgi:hypothetical protein